jgi:hypothetical protein
MLHLESPDTCVYETSTATARAAAVDVFEVRRCAWQVAEQMAMGTAAGSARRQQSFTVGNNQSLEPLPVGPPEASQQAPGRSSRLAMTVRWWLADRTAHAMHAMRDDHDDHELS